MEDKFSQSRNSIRPEFIQLEGPPFKEYKIRNKNLPTKVSTYSE